MSLDNKVVNLADLKVSHDYLLEQDELLSDKIDGLGSGIDDVESTIGNLSNLSTTQKDNIVSAINEVLQTGGKVKSVNSKTGDVVLKTSDLTNDSGYLTNYTETDPTVPSWAKQASKPTYTAQEVGASSIEDMNSEVNTRRAADAQLQSQITALGNGAPIPVETVAEMIDNTKAYLYTGAEAGWLTGYWYTYDSAQAKFIPRGEYGVGTVIDNTLTVPGDAADAKATGDAISEVNGRLDDVSDVLDFKIDKTATGNVDASMTVIPLMPDLHIKKGRTYTYTITIESALAIPIYVYLRNSGGTNINTLTVSAGTLTASKTFTAESDVVATLVLNNSNRAVSYTLTMADSETDNKIDELESTLDGLTSTLNDLETDLNDVINAVEIPINKTYSGDAIASLEEIRISQQMLLQGGHTYTYTITLLTASEQPVYVHLRNAGGTSINSLSLNAGDLTKSKVYTPTEDIEVYITLHDVNRAVSYTITIADGDSNNKIDELESTLDGLTSTIPQDINDLNEIVGRYVPDTTSGESIASTTAQYVYSPLTIINGHSYTYTITVDTASDQPVYVYIKAQQGESSSLASLTLNAGETTKSKTFTASVDTSVGAIAINTTNRKIKYTIVFTDNNAPDDYITTLMAESSMLKTFTGETDGLAFTEKAYINTPSVGGTVDITPTALNGCACVSATCQKGDIFTLYGMPRDNSGTRPYAWVNDLGYCVFRSEQTTAFDGVEIVAPYDGALVVNFLMSSDYAVYKGVRNLHGHIIENINDIKSIVNSPLETLPEYITNDLAYKPLGQLQHPYLCLSCDDGSAELETYTIPMILSKDVPCTFGLWSTSSKIGETPRFSPSVILRTQSGIDAVVNAVSHGCEVAQHGTVEWTDMTEAELNDFFDREQVAFANMGITVKGAICPSHCVNNKVRAIAGGRFGSVRSGYYGYKSKADQQGGIHGDVFTPYGLLTGARSNCYSYTSFNTIDMSLAELKKLLNNAISKNMCMIVYWHDWDLTTEQKADLEAFIDYAKTTAVNFCTLSEIPMLI